MTIPRQTKALPIDPTILRARALEVWQAHDQEQTQARADEQMKRLHNARRRLEEYLQAAFGLQVTFLDDTPAAEVTIDGLVFAVFPDDGSRNLQVGVRCEQDGCDQLAATAEIYPDPAHAFRSLGYFLDILLAAKRAEHDVRFHTPRPALEPEPAVIPDDPGSLSPGERHLILAVREVRDELANNER